MSRKKKRGSGLKRVLLASTGVLIVVLTFFIIKQINKLSDTDAYAYADAGKVDHVADAWKEQTEAPEATDVPVTTEPTPTVAVPTPTPYPTVTFAEQYAHAGEMKELYAYGNGVAYGLRYPAYEDSAMQAAVQHAAEAVLTEELNGFSEYEGAECELLIDYEEDGFGQLWSVLFRVERVVDGKKEYNAVPWVYNLKKGEAVDAETLFGERAYSYVAEKVNEALEQEEAEDITVSYYLLTADGIRFFYDTAEGEASITVPYPAVHTYMTVTVGGTVIAETIRELDPDKPMIALTFDDGPHYKNTPRLLEILAENNVHVTFFLLGDRTGWNGSPEAVQLLVESGNEIASQTHNHKMLGQLSLEDLHAEIGDARDAIYALTGDYPTFVRPPYGNYNDMVKKHADAPLILWNLDSEDWKSKNKDAIIEQVLGEAGDGKIVLCHDIHTCTIEAMEVLIPELIHRGYQIVTVRELFYYKGVEPENGIVYHSSYN